MIYEQGGDEKLRKRKREAEGSKERETKRKEDKEKYMVRYIEETNRSGYERGKEHMDHFRNMQEKATY